MTSPLTKKHNLLFKRVFDIIISTVGILLIMPWLIPLLAVIIKLDSRGPVFFRQKRNKKEGRKFTCIKFRTMVVNREADVKAAGVNDKRITRVGKFLRAYHLDELPQLFNVLAGDMSVVGPRPYMLSENKQCEKMIRHYTNRYLVKPGITGLAQSIGHFGFTDNIEEINERVWLDLVYIKEWSFKKDIKIIIRTVVNLFSATETANNEKQKTVIHYTPRPHAELVQGNILT